jgi:hypothetical protein
MARAYQNQPFRGAALYATMRRMMRYGSRAKLGYRRNTAAFWQSLRLSGVEDRVQGFGRLLSQH